MKNIFKILLNYSILFLCVVGFNFGDVLTFLLPMIQIGLSIINYLNSEKWQTVLMLEIHLLISTILGIYFMGYLFLAFISGDELSAAIFKLIMLVGIILVCIMGIITTLIKFISIKSRERNMRR